MIQQKKKLIFITAFALLTLFGASCKMKPSTPVIHEGIGVIEEINPEALTIQINHEAIPDYMPAMSMPYKVKDRALLEKIKAGDKIDFTVEDSAAGIFVIDLKKEAR